MILDIVVASGCGNDRMGWHLLSLLFSISLTMTLLVGVRG